MYKIFKYDFFKGSIYKYLSAKDLLIYKITNVDNSVNKYLKRELYNASAFFHPSMLDNSYLLMNEFDFIIEDQVYLPLFNYIKTDAMLVIAGGYTTGMNFSRDFNEKSDIDIYILNSSNESLLKLFDFIHNNYQIKSYIKYKSVITFKFDNIRDLQIIFTSDVNVINILTKFDSAHNRCAYYLGNTYITYDAQYSKIINSTCIYKFSLQRRYLKIINYNLDIINKILTPLLLDETILDNEPILYDYNNYKTCLQLDVFINWVNNYSREDVKERPSREFDIFNIPSGIYLTINNQKVNFILPNQDYNFVRFNENGYFYFEINGLYIEYTSYPKYIFNNLQITDPIMKNRIKRLKCIFFEIGKNVKSEIYNFSDFNQQSLKKETNIRNNRIIFPNLKKYKEILQITTKNRDFKEFHNNNVTIKYKLLFVNNSHFMVDVDIISIKNI